MADAPKPPRDDGVLARAAAALQSLSGEMETWLLEEVDKLLAAGDRLGERRDAQAAQALRLRAHDLKGLGGTCSRPRLGRVGASLERLLDAAPVDGQGLAPADWLLIRAHLDAAAALAAVRPDDPKAHALTADVERLEREVEQRG